MCLLQNDTDLRTERVLGDIFNVDIVNDDLAFVDVVQSHQEVDQRGFTRTGVPDNTDHLAFFDINGHVFKNRIVAVVTEGDVADTDITFNRDVNRQIDIGNFGLVLKEGKSPTY